MLLPVKFIFLQTRRALGLGIHKLEYDPHAQYRFHRVAAWVWFLAMLVLPFFPVLYGNDIGVIIIQEISLYANFATEFGSMSAAEAAIAGSGKMSIVTPDALPGTVAPYVPPVDEAKW